MIRDVKELYINRFPEKERVQRNKIWKILCKHYFQKYVAANSTILDLGAGYCEFINNIKAKEKIAVDLNLETKKSANKSVKVYICSSRNLPRHLSSKVDTVFASNFFEHLPTKEDVVRTLSEVCRVLKRNGKIIILHPNIKYLNGEYWDFLDHQLPLTEKSLAEALDLSGFKIIKMKPKFLPYSTKSNLPKWNWLIRLYLILAPLHYVFGKQSLIIGKKI